MESFAKQVYLELIFCFWAIKKTQNVERTESYKDDSRKLFMLAFGCQMNEADSEVMERLLEREGYGKIDSPEVTDVIILITCSLREHVEDGTLGYPV